MSEIIRIRYKGKIHTRHVIRNYRGWYIMSSKGKEYWFRKDPGYIATNFGWHLINGTFLPDEFLEQIAVQLEELQRSGR